MIYLVYSLIYLSTYILQGLCRYTFNAYDTCHDNTNNTCLFCDEKKFNISSGLTSKSSYLHIGCNPFRTTDEQNQSLAKAYNLERGFLTDSHSGGILCNYF